MISALALGGGLGLLNGLLGRASLAWAIAKSDKMFYSIWAAGFFYRLLFAAGFIYVLIDHPGVPLLPAILSLVAAQSLLHVFPVKNRDARF